MTLADGVALAFGCVAGALILITGVGAGAMVVPGLIGLFNLTPAVAVGTASVFSVLTKLLAGSSHVLTHNVSWPLFASFGRVALPATLLAAVATNGAMQWWPSSSERLQLGLHVAVIFAATMALTMALVPELARRLRASGERTLPLLSGLLVGATGVGGGVLIVPSLLASSAEPAKRIIGTSVVLGLVLSGITGTVFALSGALAWRLTVMMSLGAIVSMPFAARLFERVSERALKGLSSALIALAIGSMALDVLASR